MKAPSALERCPECDGPLRTTAGEIYCDGCGLVTAEGRIDRGPEWWRFGDSAADRERTGDPVMPSRHDRGLSAEIGYDAVDSGRKRRQLYRLRREHNRARFRSKAERNLAVALGEIARMAGALDLPRSARERSSVIYRQARRQGLLYGRSIEAIAAASVYAACRCDRLVRTVDEVASVARCSGTTIERTYLVLNRELGLAVPVVRPAEVIPKLASAVESPDGLRERATELVELAEAAGYATGRHPGGLAAAGVYRAGHEFGQLYTQAELAELADVTTTTLRARLDELDELIG